MKQEEKQLLIQDLCARLPYGIKCITKLTGYNDVYTVQGVYEDNVFIDSPVYEEGDDMWMIESIIPFLRPMSSMTEEEDKEYAEVIVKSQDCSLENSESATTMSNDWLLSKGFDVRGLISKGLALEAPEWMYNNKTR